MAAGCDAAKDATLGVNPKTGFRRRGAWKLRLGRTCPAALALGEQKARQPEGERCLADAARPGQQNRMRQTPDAAEPPELALGHLMADQNGVPPRRRGRTLVVIAHA